MMNTETLMIRARDWVVENYPYNSGHLLRTLEWLDRLQPNLPDAVRMAALTHDMERAFPGADSPKITFENDPEYYRVHSERSARIVGDWLLGKGADVPFVAQVKAHILVHEFGGWQEADLVQAADSLSFFSTNVDLVLGFVRSGKHPQSAIRSKLEHTYNRIRLDPARNIAKPMFAEAMKKLADLESASG